MLPPWSDIGIGHGIPMVRKENENGVEDSTAREADIIQSASPYLQNASINRDLMDISRLALDG